MMLMMMMRMKMNTISDYCLTYIHEKEIEISLGKAHLKFQRSI